MRRRVALAVALTLGCACGPSVDLPDGGILPDAGPAEPPPTPLVDAVPPVIPYSVLTLRGSAEDARRVLIEGPTNHLASPVLPDDTFCVDVPLAGEGAHRLAVYAHAPDGQLSATPAVVTVTRDPLSSPVLGAETCAGTDPAGCPAAVETCDNGRDDDCNGLADGHDPACSTCEDDVLAGADPSAPRIEPGRHEGLVLCPGTDDYFGVRVSAGATVTVRLYFDHSDGNLDLALLAPDLETVVGRSTSTSDDEAVEVTAEATGDHKVRVYGVDAGEVRYVLDVRVAGP